MKVAVVVAFCGLMAFVAAEQCRQSNDCSHVTCDAGHQLECHLRQCTCSDTGSKCMGSGDCSGNCRHGDWHCVDNTCRCGWGIGNIIDNIGGIGK